MKITTKFILILILVSFLPTLLVVSFTFKNWETLAFILLIDLFSIAAIWLLTHRLIIQRVIKSAKIIEKLNQEQFECKIEVKSNDEMGAIENNLNNLCAKLKSFTIELEKSEEKKYQNLINAIPLCIKWFDAKGNMLFINKAGMEEHFLKTQEEAMKWNYLDTINPAFKETAVENMQKALKGESRQIEFMHTPEGSTHEWCESWLSPLKNIKGNPTGLLFISTDITKRKKDEQKIKELDETKSKFIHKISHQMRSPLNGIRWSLEIILGGTLGKITKDQENMLKTSYEANKKIITQINDFIIALDIEEGKIKLEPEEAHLDSIVDTILIEYEKSAKAKKLKINFKKPKIRTAIRIDIAKIQTVISKLIDNAIKYTPEDGELNLEVKEKEGHIYFIISDTGIGIPADDQDKIFTKFYRATNASIMVPDASGIGLFIAKALIEAHNGKIWFNSKESKGSEFYFKLPIK